jgi:hypothetical protein
MTEVVRNYLPENAQESNGSGRSGRSDSPETADATTTYNQEVLYTLFAMSREVYIKRKYGLASNDNISKYLLEAKHVIAKLPKDQQDAHREILDRVYRQGLFSGGLA